MKIAVLGAGAWGTALSLQASVRHSVTLWARSSEHAAAMQAMRSNAKYLSGYAFPETLKVTCEPLAAWLGEFDLIIIATPMSALRWMLTQLSNLLVQVPVVWLCKGFEAPLAKSESGAGEHPTAHVHKGLLAHEILASIAPKLTAGVLSGPSFAQEVASSQPTALVAASSNPQVRRVLVDAFHTDKLRIYSSDDLIGVEVGGAVKNVLAIATGLCDGLELGLNARAALITRGLSEMTALGVALGAKSHTFMGLSGLGDLVLTTTGDLSRNRRVGLCLAKGMSLQETLDSLGHVAEGVYSAHTVTQRAAEAGVEMPISSAVVGLLQGSLKVSQVVAHLMGRSAKDEALDLNLHSNLHSNVDSKKSTS